MTDKLSLYYDEHSQVFSLAPTSENKVVFETHNREGWDNGKNEIMQDYFRIEIQTNFYPKALHREYIYVNIYINNILLLPISKAWRKVVSQNSSIIKDIFIEEWGNNIGVVSCYPKSPSTIVLLRKRAKGNEFNWFEVLSSICHICNNYEKWIEKEVVEFVTKMQKCEKVYWRRLASAILLLRTYDTIVPNLSVVYRPTFDIKVLSAVQCLCSRIERTLTNEYSSQNKIPRQEANVLWKYLTDYLIK